MGQAANVRFLARLVTALTLVMIAGMIAIVVLMALRLNRAPALPLPDRIALPEGSRARSVTIGEGWYLVVTEGDEILVYDRLTGHLRQRVQIAP
jgi:hypothetical protein